MNNYQKAKKAEPFIKSSKEIMIALDFCKPESIKGVTDEEIRTVEKKLDINFPPVSIAYLRHMGEEARVRKTTYDCNIKLTEIDFANSFAKQNIEWDRNDDLKQKLASNSFRVNYDPFEDNADPSKYIPIQDLVDLENIMVYHYDPTGKIFYFLDSTQDNPIVYSFVNYESIVTEFLSATNVMRESFILYVGSCATDNYAEIEYSAAGKKTIVGNAPSIDYLKYPYLKDYIQIFKKGFSEVLEILKERKKYYRINDEIEKKDERILTVHEFETNFLNYLKEKGFKF